MESARPDEPAQRDNPLELSPEPAAETAVTPSGSPELVLPDGDEPVSPPATQQLAPASEPAALTAASANPPSVPAPSAATSAGPLGNLVAAHFQRVEVAMLGRVLVATLAGALPRSMIQVQRRRSIAQRLSGKPGQPIGITITAGERMLSFRAPEIGVTEAKVSHAVRGVVLSSSLVPVSEWLDQLGELLNEVARNDEATRLALERALVH